MRFLRGVEAIHLSLVNGGKKRKGKILLACPLWLQTYVSIANRFVNLAIKTYHQRCRKFITYDVLLIFPQLFDKFKCDILRKLCMDNALHNLIKIHDRFEWSRDDVLSDGFRWACSCGHLDTAKWLYTVFQLTVDDAR